MMQPLLRSCSFVALALLTPSAAAGTLYVDANLTTGLGDGSSWANAYRGTVGLRLALFDVVAGDRIFVAQGTYLPDSSSRLVSFVLPDGVELYGSFLGGESSPAERPPFGTADSVLSGDLAGDDGSGMFEDNSFRVVRASGGATSVLDGFVVRGGNASGFNGAGGGLLCLDADLAVRNCRFVENLESSAALIEDGTVAFLDCAFEDNLESGARVEGGAVTFLDCTFEDNLEQGLSVLAGDVASERCAFVRNGEDGVNVNAGGTGKDATMTFLDCAFEDNLGHGLSVWFQEVTIDRCSFVGNGDTGLQVSSSSPIFVSNSLIADNTGSWNGGAALGGSGDHQVSNCTVVGNTAGHPSAYGGLTGAVVVNSIVWDNTPSQVTGEQVAGSVTHSIVQGGYPGAGNLSTDPRFRDAEGGDYSLVLASPGIDAGDNSGVPPGATLDLASNPRFHDEPCIPDVGQGMAPIVDIGAYEFPGAQLLGTTYCSPAVPNSTGASGVMKVTGSDVVADDDVVLVALDLPTSSNIGYFLMGTGTNTFTPPGSAGPICVAPGIRRYLPPINNTAERPGAFSRVVGTAGPISGNITAGSTWNFQAWHRDAAAGTSNLTDAVSVDFQ